MTPNRQRRIALNLSALVLILPIADRCAAQRTQPPDELIADEIKTYRVDVAKVSFDASRSLDSFRGGGELSGSPGSTLGTSTPDADISIQVLAESNHLYADVTITGRGDSNANEPKAERFDLTNLRPQVVELGTTKDGRSYHLNLIPSVRTIKVRPRPFAEAADDLYRLKFHSSRVMLNDSEYVGRMLATDALVFSMEVSDIASLEFSLQHLKDAEPWGRLQDGRITFRHPDGTTLEIDNVTNGGDDRLVGDGPYLVWVRWEKPQVTEAEYRTQLVAYRDQIKSGEMPATEGALAAIDKELARKPGPWVVSCGAREPSKNELVDEESNPVK